MQKLSLCWLVALIALPSIAADAAPGLVVAGLPGAAGPHLEQRLEHALLFEGEEPTTVTMEPQPWFWHQTPTDGQIRVTFSQYHAGRTMRTLIPLVSARYSYLMEARGTVALTSNAGDTVYAARPFDFMWTRPVAYQMLGILPEAAGMQINPVTMYQLESQALEELAGEIAKQVERARAERQGD